jgi:hypothetical protein
VVTKWLLEAGGTERTVAAVENSDTLTTPNFWLSNGTESDVSQNVTQHYPHSFLSQWQLYSHRPSV